MQLEKQKEIQAWLRKASEDLRTVELVLGVTPPLTDTAGFHCQQACEKILKAFLVSKDATFGKSHDLDVLLQEATKYEPSLNSDFDCIRDYTTYATTLRYPGDNAPLEMEEVTEALATAKKLFVKINSLIAVTS